LQVLVNREQPVNTSDSIANPGLLDGTFRPAALVFRSAEPNVVDRVMISSTVADMQIIKVLMRHTRRPEVRTHLRLWRECGHAVCLEAFLPLDLVLL
jgi:DNA-directed RNA polymerase III subunit RPC2